jgi:NAD(P)-dependent dehydrogenase (short-subunit alcohol dehydrogenase family)
MARRVLVTGTHPLAVGIADGMAARGDDVLLLAPDVAAGDWEERRVPCSFGSEDEVTAAVRDAVDRLGGLDQVVHTWVDAGVLVEHEFVALDAEQWVRSCEGSLEGAWWLMRHLSEPLRASGGGSVVVVVPSIAHAGGAGATMLATVGEGLRVLAKGCGRQWAKWGITVNTVATAPHHWVGAERGEQLVKAISLSVPAFGGVGDASDDLGALVAGLAQPEMHFLTAGTLMADGGVWMGL